MKPLLQATDPSAGSLSARALLQEASPQIALLAAAHSFRSNNLSPCAFLECRAPNQRSPWHPNRLSHLPISSGANSAVLIMDVRSAALCSIVKRHSYSVLHEIAQAAQFYIRHPICSAPRPKQDGKLIPGWNLGTHSRTPPAAIRAALASPVPRQEAEVAVPVAITRTYQRIRLSQHSGLAVALIPPTSRVLKRRREAALPERPDAFLG